MQVLENLLSGAEVSDAREFVEDCLTLLGHALHGSAFLVVPHWVPARSGCWLWARATRSLRTLRMRSRAALIINPIA